MKFRWLTAILFSLALAASGAPPPDEAAQLQFADGLFRRGIYDMALKEYMLYLEKYPASPSADIVWFRSGECYREMGNRIGADRAYGRVQAMPASPHRFRSTLRRAELQGDAGQDEAALALLRRLLADGPPADLAADALFRMGNALERLNRPAEAAASYETLIKDHPESAFHAYALLALGGLVSATPGGGARAGGKEK